MKGALDLGKSLKVLVSVQETTEYMGNSTRKSQIKLLEDGEGVEAPRDQSSRLKKTTEKFKSARWKIVVSYRQQKHKEILMLPFS
ncbi:hypothetical protein Droror1_Dr00020604 [Drosera rotundifolia]